MESFDLVTGGAGFIGSHLSQALQKKGRRVKVLDDLSTGRRSNLEPLLQTAPGQFEFIEGDIRDLELLKRVVEGADSIFHQAAIPSVQHSIDDPAMSNSVNVTGALNVLVAAKDGGVKNVVLASSCSIYGDSEELPKRESMEINPLSPYAVTKRCDELYAKVFSGVYGLSCVSLRYFNVFGPRQDPSSDYAAVVPKFITRMLDGVPPIIFGDGEQSRDFIYVENVARANMLGAEADVEGQILNIGCGEQRTLNQLVTILNGILGTSFEPEYRESRAGDVRKSEGDISLAREVIGFEPTISVQEGLEKTVEWFQRQRAIRV